MQFTFPLAAAAVVSMAALVPAAPATTECCFKADDASHTKVREEYTALWGGKLSLLDTLCEPDMHLYQDRFPNGNGSAFIPISSSQDFLHFVESSRQGWDHYAFVATNWVAKGNQVVLRWKLDGIVGANFSLPTTLKQGDHVTYNGTDYLTLDSCTGRIKEVDSAQDFITFFHNIGMTDVKV